LRPKTIVILCGLGDYEAEGTSKSKFRAGNWKKTHPVSKSAGVSDVH